MTRLVCVAGFYRQVSVQRQQSSSGPEQTEAAGEAVSPETSVTRLNLTPLERFSNCVVSSCRPELKPVEKETEVTLR